LHIQITVYAPLALVSLVGGRRRDPDQGRENGDPQREQHNHDCDHLRTFEESPARPRKEELERAGCSAFAVRPNSYRGEVNK
jgi:hypothetical protein